jgi:integrase
VPLLPRLTEALENLYAGEDESLFVLRTRAGTPLSRHNARRSIREAASWARLGDRVTPHVLRHTFGTACSNAGMPVAAAVAMLGHSVEVNHSTYVKAHRDGLERDWARSALVALGLGVTPA